MNFSSKLSVWHPVGWLVRILEKRTNMKNDDEDDDSYWNIVGISMSWIELKMGTKGDFLEKN